MIVDRVWAIVTSVAAIAAGAVALWQCGQIATLQIDIARAGEELASEQAGRLQDRAIWASGTAQAEANQREIETMRRRAREQVITDAQATIARQAGAAADLRAELAGLRGDLDRAAASTVGDRAGGEAGRDPAAATGGAPAAGAGLVLSELRGGPIEEIARLATELAIAYDASRSRGLACERISDGLTALR